jgi:predicted PurR-regulated permease PerM
MLLGACLFVTRPVLLPVVAAFVISLTLAPLMLRAERLRVPKWLSAVVLVLLLLVVAASVVTLIVAPMSAWIARAPAVGAALKQKLYVLDAPLNALRQLLDTLMPSDGNAVTVQNSQLSMVTPVLAVLTPAVTQIVVFFVSLLFFLEGHTDIRRYLPSLFSRRDTKLRVIRIANDIGANLASYLAAVTAINAGLGVLVGLGAWAYGIPNPLIFGVLAAVLNYIPYVGPAVVVFILFGVSLVTFPDLPHALLPPASFFVLTTLEGQIISPAILGTRLPLSALAIFISLAFWIWLWGPIGALLAVPLAIIARVIVGHVFPSGEPPLPD